MSDYLVLTPEQQQQAQVQRLGQLEAEHWSQQLRIDELEAVIAEGEQIADPTDDQTAALEAYQAQLAQMERLHQDTEWMMKANQQSAGPALQAAGK